MKDVIFLPKFPNDVVVGIDVAADFSYVAILDPDGELAANPFKIVNYDIRSLEQFTNKLKEVEKLYSTPIRVVMESTGIYHMPLSHFLEDKGFDVFILNPIISNSSKNDDIRKVKNDKRDAFKLAELIRTRSVKLSKPLPKQISRLRQLCRQHYRFVDTRAANKLRLGNQLRLIMPGYHTVFTDVTSAASMAVLRTFEGPQAICDASQDALVSLLAEHARKGTKWATKKAIALQQVAEAAVVLGFSYPFDDVIEPLLEQIDSLTRQIGSFIAKIHACIEGKDFPSKVFKNIELIQSLPGIGFVTAVSLVAEIGDFDGFIKPKHLVAFFGVDPAVNQSGKFRGDRINMSKRGTKIGRRALYTLALSSVKTKRNKEITNPVIREFYQEKCKSKKKKVALVAVMHKLINYIFSIFRDQKPYELRSPAEHKAIHIHKKVLQPVA